VAILALIVVYYEFHPWPIWALWAYYGFHPWPFCDYGWCIMDSIQMWPFGGSFSFLFKKKSPFKTLSDFF
jgi:hypothetical protein